MNDDDGDIVDVNQPKDENNKQHQPNYNATSSNIYAIPDYSIFSDMILARKRAVLYVVTAGIVLVAILWAVMSRKYERVVDVDMGFDFAPASNKYFNAASVAGDEDLREFDYQPWQHTFDYVNVTDGMDVDAVIRDLRGLLHKNNLMCLTPAYYTKEKIPNVMATKNGYVFINVHNVTGTKIHDEYHAFFYQSKLKLSSLLYNITFNHDDDNHGVPTRITSDEYAGCFQIYYNVVSVSGADGRVSQ
jgi:hypothetical protein